MNRRTRTETFRFAFRNSRPSELHDRWNLWGPCYVNWKQASYLADFAVDWGIAHDIGVIAGFRGKGDIVYALDMLAYAKSSSNRLAKAPVLDLLSALKKRASIKGGCLRYCRVIKQPHLERELIDL